MEEDITIRKIRIFVAGAKKLQAKRDFVKRIVSEYNTKKFDLYMKPFFFYVYDYTSFYPAQQVKEDNYTYDTYKTIRTFIVPEGVKGFAADLIRGIRVVERFELPESLTCIGENCFTNCILPEVIIPQSVHKIGIFAFGHSHIGTLQLPTTIRSLYGRQFKDSHIGVLRLPKEWKNHVALGEYNELCLDNEWFDNDKYGYLRWSSTKIENLKFY